MLLGSRKTILNVGLNLALEWGEEWLKPIQGRLSKKYPQMSKVKLDEYNETCQEAMKLGHSLVLELANEDGFDINILEFKEKYLQKYPWVSEENVSRVFSQGMYYSMK